MINCIRFFAISGVLLFSLGIFGQEREGRIQDPVKPYPYTSENVFFINKSADSIKLAGTLTVPKDVMDPPVAILISGSGLQNRDSEVFNHRPFLVLSDYLTKNGIAVLRYDDRGVGESEGDPKEATSEDFATDTEAAISFLKKRSDIDTNKIGLIGHSEGGFIASMVASRTKDVAFVISLAGNGVSGKKVLLSQAKKTLDQFGSSKEYIEVDQKSRAIIFSAIEEEDEKDVLVTKAKERLKMYQEALSEEKKKYFIQVPSDYLVAAYSESNWLRYFIKTDPYQFISKVSVPVLAINGSKDVQVLSTLNLNGFEAGLAKAGNKDYTIKELDGLNHLFQKANTGVISEYAGIQETFNPKALEFIKDWIVARFK